MTTRQSKIIKTVVIEPLVLRPIDYKNLTELWGASLSQELKNELGSAIQIYRKTLPLIKATTPASIKKSLSKLIELNLDFLSRAIDEETHTMLEGKINELVKVANTRINQLDGLRLNTSSEAINALKENLIILFRGYSPYKLDDKYCLKFVCKVFDVAGIQRPDWQTHPKRFWN